METWSAKKDPWKESNILYIREEKILSQGSVIYRLHARQTYTRTFLEIIFEVTKIVL